MGRIILKQTSETDRHGKFAWSYPAPIKLKKPAKLVSKIPMSNKYIDKNNCIFEVHFYNNNSMHWTFVGRAFGRIYE